VRGDVCCCCSCWGETTSQNCSRERFMPQIDICIRSPSGIILTRENRITQRNPCSSVTLSTTSPTWTDLGANWDLHSESAANNRLSCGTAWGGGGADNHSQFLEMYGGGNSVVSVVPSTVNCGPFFEGSLRLTSSLRTSDSCATIQFLKCV
jgi:hypothetical protein